MFKMPHLHGSLLDLSYTRLLPSDIASRAVVKRARLIDLSEIMRGYRRTKLFTRASNVFRRYFPPFLCALLVSFEQVERSMGTAGPLCADVGSDGVNDAHQLSQEGTKESLDD